MTGVQTCALPISCGPIRIAKVCLTLLYKRHSARGAFPQSMSGAQIAAAAAMIGALSGCSMAVPTTGAAMWGGRDDDVTGSIAKPSARTVAFNPQNLKLSKALDAEDARRAGLTRAQSFSWDTSAATLRRAYGDAVRRRRERAR